MWPLSFPGEGRWLDSGCVQGLAGSCVSSSRGPSRPWEDWAGTQERVERSPPGREGAVACQEDHVACGKLWTPLG